MLKILRVSILCLLAAGVAPLQAQKDSGSGSVATSTSSTFLWSRLTEDISKLAGKVDGRVGVYIQSFETGETCSLRADEIFPAASTIKLALLLELYRQTEGGKGPVQLTDAYRLIAANQVEGSAILGNLAPGTRLTLRDLALFTVVVSDNSATNVLIDRLGMDRVNATLERLGLKATRLRRKMMDVRAAREGRENHTSPRELGELLAAIHHGPVLSQAARADLLHLLQTPKDGFLTRLLPEDLPVANKPGTLPGIRNDAGIVFVKGSPFVVVVMTSHLRDEREGEEVIARIARRVAASLEVAGAASPEGRLFGPLLIR